MDAPPREQRARAAFFREKEARRIAKKQRKKERLLAKVAHSALSSDVAPPLPQSASLPGASHDWHCAPRLTERVAEGGGQCSGENTLTLKSLRHCFVTACLLPGVLVTST